MKRRRFLNQYQQNAHDIRLELEARRAARRRPGTLPLWLWAALFFGIVLAAALLSPARSLGF
ncbi:hypothetical protein AB4099_05425 [Bosea sp. 2KB_26]|uniref:hypothetical protein n=1 Tax=Bosea sp. 2KB_26 TaxID=3237475 RepID=UPI003F8FE372